MQNLNLFIPITKMDEENRLVYGVVTEEVIDKTGEVFDYDSSKPFFEKWSGEIEKASGGKSRGNVRVMHTAKAAGKLTDISFDDQEKRISCVAKIVDDDEWKMCLEGVYTGFSQGGKYVRRWTDTEGNKRYTANPSEISIVDNPCLGTAHFELIKADGAIEEREFMTTANGGADTAPQKLPTNDEVKARASALAKVAGKPDRPQDYVVKARLALIEELNAAPAEEPAEDVAKAAEEPAEAAPEAEEVAKAAEEPEAAAEAPADPAAALEAVLDKAAKVGDPEEEPVAKAHITPALAETGTALAKLAELYPASELHKGFYLVGKLAEVVSQVAAIQAMSAWEEAAEGDAHSVVPEELGKAVAQLGVTLIAMANEEVAEAMAEMEAMGEALEIEAGEDETLTLAARTLDLVKADSALIEKAGARHSKGDMAKLQAIHDRAHELGAACEAPAEKAAEPDDLIKVLDEKARLEGVIAKAVPQIEALGEKLEKALGEIELLKAQPMPPKTAASVHAVVEKGADAAGIPAEPTLSDEDIKKAFEALPEAERGAILMKLALRNPKAVTNAA